MDETAPQTWYFREGGVITQTAWDVADVTPMLRANAYAKAVRGEALTDDERAAVSAAKGQPLMHTVSGNLAGDVGLGFLFLQAPELVQRLDDLIGEWAKRLGYPDFMAWQLAEDYTQRALAVTMDEAGMNRADPNPFEADVSPDERARWAAQHAESLAFNEAWEASPEAKAAVAAMAPDDGPEGWSTVPGREAAGVAIERQNAFARRYRAERGLPPLPSLEPKPRGEP